MTDDDDVAGLIRAGLSLESDVPKAWFAKLAAALERVLARAEAAEAEVRLWKARVDEGGEIIEGLTARLEAAEAEDLFETTRSKK